MPVWHRKHPLPLLLSVFLLCVHSAHTSVISRRLAGEKSILTSTKLPHIRAFLQRLTEPVRLWSSSAVDRSENLVPDNKRIRTTRSSTAVRQSNDGNFVIFVSSPGKNGHLIPIPETADKDSKQLNNGKESQSIDAEAVTILGSQPAGSALDHENIPKDSNNSNSGSNAPKRNPNSSSSADPVPEADAFLDVTTGTGNPNENILVQPKSGDETPESTFEVELTVLGPSSEESLTSKDTLSAPAYNDDGGDSEIDKENNSDHAKPQPSVAPGPEEQPVILIPPDTDVDDSTPDPEEIDNNIPVESTIPEATTAVESSEHTEATPESESPNPQNINATSPSKTEREPSHLKEGQPRPERDEGSAAILVDVPLSVSSSEQSISPEFDSHARNYLGETTGTSADKWKPTKMSTTVRTVQRQDRYKWEVTYQGKLSEAAARKKMDKLEKDINKGAMDAYLEERMSTEVTVRTMSTPVVGAPEGDRVSLTETKETSSESGATNVEGKGRGNRVGIILGTCFGLLGALVLAAVAFAFVKRRRGKEEHILDGIATVPTTVSSFLSDRSESEVRTGAPTRPRGATVLRNQSRILDWQMDYEMGIDKVRRIG